MMGVTSLEENRTVCNFTTTNNKLRSLLKFEQLDECGLYTGVVPNIEDLYRPYDTLEENKTLYIEFKIKANIFVSTS